MKTGTKLGLLALVVALGCAVLWFHPLAWVAARPVQSLYTTAVAQAEILHGVALLRAGRRRNALQSAADSMFREDFAGRVLAFDGDAARAYAGIAATRRRAGRPISQLDAQIAAIASSRGASLATRNLGDFAGCGVDLVNPWET